MQVKSPAMSEIISLDWSFTYLCIFLTYNFDDQSCQKTCRDLKDNSVAIHPIEEVVPQYLVNKEYSEVHRNKTQNPTLTQRREDDNGRASRQQQTCREECHRTVYDCSLPRPARDETVNLRRVVPLLRVSVKVIAHRRGYETRRNCDERRKSQERLLVT